MKLLFNKHVVRVDFPLYVTPRLLTQATALISCCKAPLSSVTKEPAAVTCDVPSELHFFSSTVPRASVNSRVGHKDDEDCDDTNTVSANKIVGTVSCMSGRNVLLPNYMSKSLKFHMLLHVGVKLRP
jgi:hypothetical protein